MGNTEILEEWKHISGYEGLYRVSNFGNVMSLYRDKLLRPRRHSGGYMRVHLSKNGESKDFYIHRLVALEFIHNPENKPEVNHKDGNKDNNHVSNLEWSTHSENQKHSFDNGLNKSPKAMLGKFGKNHNNSKSVSKYCLDGNFIEEYGSMLEAERETGIKACGISECCRGNQKTSGGYIWKYS